VSSKDGWTVPHNNKALISNMISEPEYIESQKIHKQKRKMASVESPGFPEKFAGTNFHTWKVKMEMVLLGRDLWSVVEGRELKPSTPGTRQIAQHRKDGQARASILLNVKDSTL
jgi:hypothetical protein